MDALSAARARWGIELHRATRNEYAGPCPFCGGEDRFRVWLDKSNYWCRSCQAKGFISENETLTPEEIRLRRIESEQREIKRRQDEQERRLSALERMHQCTDHLGYHHSINDRVREYWHSEGINDSSIDRYLLGYCLRCPTASNGSPSYTIPVINGGKLENIRHRLIREDGGKYRPHIAGLGIQLFNADYLDDANPESIIITEGEKKSIVLAQNCFPNVGIVGKRAWKAEWLPRFARFPKGYIALDPDAMASAYRLGAMFGGRARVVQLPVKADDCFAKYGATPDDFDAFLKFARPA